MKPKNAASYQGIALEMPQVPNRRAAPSGGGSRTDCYLRGFVMLYVTAAGLVALPLC